MAENNSTQPLLPKPLYYLDARYDDGESLPALEVWATEKEAKEAARRLSKRVFPYRFEIRHDSNVIGQWKHARRVYAPSKRLYRTVYDPKVFSHRPSKTGSLHIRIAENALGKKLPKHAEVHHVNEDKRDNRNCNLVICPNCKYHRLLHARMRILKAGGDPNTDKICSSCKSLKSRSSFGLGRREYDGLDTRCKDCVSRETRARWRKKHPIIKRVSRCR